jgi:hypothetical protein
MVLQGLLDQEVLNPLVFLVDLVNPGFLVVLVVQMVRQVPESLKDLFVLMVL